ncbi:MAG: hypothetical protein ACON4C_11565 [Henriciella sp.]
MRVYLSASDIPVVKRWLRQAIPNVQASIRTEAMARGFGFNTNAALLAEVKTGNVSLEVNEIKFVDFLHQRGSNPPDRTLPRAVIRTLIEPVLEANPRLTTHGFGVPNSYGWSGPKYTNEVKRSRDEYYDDWQCDQFELALLLLQHCQKRKTLNRNVTSYGLKHTAERISREHKIRTDLGNYVSNGVLIAAAFYEGFDVRPIEWGSLNAYLNISSKSLKHFKTKGSIYAILENELEIAA